MNRITHQFLLEHQFVEGNDNGNTFCYRGEFALAPNFGVWIIADHISGRLVTSPDVPLWVSTEDGLRWAFLRFTRQQL